MGAAGLAGVAVHDYHNRSFARDLLESGYFAVNGLSELKPLADRFGPTRHSRNFEEWCIRDFFGDRRAGVFLDVGSNDYKQDSNTFYLETALGWSGVAIDALPEFATGYATHRPRTTFIAGFVSDKDDEFLEFYVPETNKQVASATLTFTEREGTPGTARTVPTVTLNTLLANSGVSKVDFLSMDIELAEPAALAGFDIDRFKPDLVCIEAHPDVRQQIVDYFTAHRYALVARYLRIDTQNLYFAPMG